MTAARVAIRAVLPYLTTPSVDALTEDLAAVHLNSGRGRFQHQPPQRYDQRQPQHSQRGNPNRGMEQPPPLPPTAWSCQ